MGRATSFAAALCLSSGLKKNQEIKINTYKNTLYTEHAVRQQVFSSFT